DRLLAARNPSRCHLLASQDLDSQISEVARAFRLFESFRPLTRCPVCNGVLAPAARESVAAIVPEKVLESRQEYWQCPDCGKVYWQGTHFDRIKDKIQRLAAASYDKIL
ncbi:MAG: Mut7-C RNAse domain-containing protein, partial [bacterium]